MKIGAAVFGVIVAWVAASGAQAAQQFDLVCSGTETVLGSEASTPWAYRIAVDLDRGAFCPNNCQQVSQIDRIEPGRLVFWDEPGREATRPQMEVNRATGKIRKSSNGFMDEGICTVAPFTPMPPNKF